MKTGKAWWECMRSQHRLSLSVLSWLPRFLFLFRSPLADAWVTVCLPAVDTKLYDAVGIFGQTQSTTLTVIDIGIDDKIFMRKMQQQDEREDEIWKPMHSLFYLLSVILSPALVSSVFSFSLHFPLSPSLTFFTECFSDSSLMVPPSHSLYLTFFLCLSHPNIYLSNCFSLFLSSYFSCVFSLCCDMILNVSLLGVFLELSLFLLLYLITNWSHII